MHDASHASDSVSSSSHSDDAKKGESTQAEGEKQTTGADDFDSLSSSEDEEGFLDISYLREDILPLITGKSSDVESGDEGNLVTGKRKRASLLVATKSKSAEAGSSRPSKKRRTIEELATEWGMSVEDAKTFSAEHIAALRNIAT